ncbi:UNVERIFIED_CONTAM: hypothetical protein HDU68_002690 [Siphonaria sp. JEL0065]|nr:hypothetical protein HDU68_002690 [Siphonaria sp. JEL0065]
MHSTKFTVTPANKPVPVPINTQSTSAPHYITTLREYKTFNGVQVLQGTQTDASTFIQTSNGFMDSIVRAYNQHHNIVIRPDDVWIAIMLQFSFFVNGNAESLRSKFVSHSDKKELEIIEMGTLTTVDYGKLANRMATLMRNHITDVEVCDWVSPSFTTTTDNDRIVGSVVLMTAMQKYFSYKFSLRCGIPEVTILGTVDDWKDIQKRVKKLEEYGKECAKWSGMLSVVIGQYSGGSGPTYLSGWLSAFGVFNAEGKWNGKELYVKNVNGVQFPAIDTDDIPAGYATVDVLVDDNGADYKCAMFVGHTGYDVIDVCGVAPKFAWAMVVKKNAADQK